MIFCLGLVGLYDFKTCQDCKKYIFNILLKILQIIPAHGAGYMLVDIINGSRFPQYLYFFDLSPKKCYPIPHFPSNLSEYH